MPDKETSAKTETSLRDWLEGVGLSHYGDLLIRHCIGLDVISDLTESDLAAMGIPLGDRKRLQRAILSLAHGGSSDVLTSSSVRSSRITVGAERRQLTVMFCDMVGSSSLSEQYDPEDVRSIIAAYRETCVRELQRYEGFVARYIGDGILVYFGYPNAHEDDPERAVLAGLEIVRALAALTHKPNGLVIDVPAVRIGIATGLVVVGDLVGNGTEEHDSAVGETLNLAARLQGLAPPGGIVITASTQSLLGRKFEYRDLGVHELKGLAENVQVWHVVRSYHVESRFEGGMGSRLTPMVNREEEIALLLMRWRQATAGDGQVVLLSGEPGIGKSRVVRELRERIGSERHGRILFQCSPYYTSTAFYPFVEQFKFALGMDREGSSALSLGSLEAAIATAKGNVEKVMPIFAELLSIPTGDRFAPLELFPQQRKDATVSALVSHLIGLAHDEPMVMTFEDVHWIDPASREVLDLLVDTLQDSPILLILTCRSEFKPSWYADSHITTLTLNRLGRPLRTTLVQHVAGTRELPKEIVEEIIVKTDGVPLFIEELTKAVLESNLSEKNARYILSGPGRHLAIPATLTDSLMARLDRMGPSKKFAQIGATIGREFSYEIMRLVADAPGAQLNAALSHLEEAGLIVRRGPPTDAVYSFKHVMIQNAAHSSLLHSDRKTLHAKIARILAEKYPERTEREPELLAHHFTQADQSEAAVGFWLKAGKQTAKTGSNLGAIGHLQDGLDVVERHPQMRGRDEIELELRIRLGNALIAAKGYTHREVEENYVRALELGQQLNDNEKVFAATRGLWVCHCMRADLTKAYDLSMTLLKFASRKRRSEATQQVLQKTGYLIEAHRAVAMTMFYRGQFVDSQRHLERSLDLYDIKLHGHLIEKHGTDPGVVSLSYLGILLWFTGYPDKARQYSAQAIADAEKIGHPFTLAFALEFGAYLCQHLRDVEATRDYADRAMVVSSEHGFKFWEQQSKILGGWALTELGQMDDGLNQMRAGLNGYEAMNSWLASSWFTSLPATAYSRAGQLDAAFRALDDALAISKRTGEVFFLAEIYRRQGEITLAHGGQTAIQDAEDCFNHSLTIARQQKALSLELRTGVSLARLWLGTGKRQEAADLLSPIIGKFKEGLLTPDVKEALQLMNELAAN